MCARTCWTTSRISWSVTCMGYFLFASPCAEKMVLFSTLTVSTMPTMVASTGSFSVSGVRRALDPCTISTSSPCPAPTASTTTNVRPVVTSRSRCAGSTRSGSTVSSLWPVMVWTFWVATTLPVTRARNMRETLLLLPPSPQRGEGGKTSDGAAGRLQQLLRLPGDDQLLVGRHDPQLHAAAQGVDARLRLALDVQRGVDGDAEPVQVLADRRAHGGRVLADA